MAGAADGNEMLPDTGDTRTDPSQMTGAEGEQPGYNHLKSTGAFEASLETPIEHASDRRDAVMEHLSTGRAS
jgi:hypothetical protein